MHFFEKKLQKNLVISKKSSTFAPAFEKKQLSGAVVQLVRIPACHAVGREFESRPHRKKDIRKGVFLVLRDSTFYVRANFSEWKLLERLLLRKF